MNLLDLLTPWLTLAAILVPLVYTEKWIHSHLYGVGWLLTEDEKSATALYYVLLFPGVFLHEFTQYLMAGALNVKIKRIIQWPEAQKDGTLRLDFVQIQEANWFQAAIIGATPLILGLALVWLISSQVLSLDQVVAAIQAQDSQSLQAALKNLTSTPDFFLWLYVIFTISNAMLPTPADRQGWPLLLAVFAGVIGVLVLIGVGDVLYEKATGPLANAVDNVTTAFAMVLAVEVPGIIFIGFLEEVLERITKRKFQYNRGRAQAATSSSPTKRVPGSNLPLPPGVPLPSIYNIHLPVPDPPSNIQRAISRRRSAAAAKPPSASTSAPSSQGAPAPFPGTAEKREAASTTQPESQPTSAATRGARPEPLRQDDRTQQDRRFARPAEPSQTPRTPSRASRRPPDDRRAQPLSPPHEAASGPGARRLDQQRPGADRRAQDADSPRPGRSDQERAPFARPASLSPQTQQPRPGRPGEEKETTREPQDRFTRRPRPEDQPADDDRTQRLERTGRLRMPGSSRPRPDMQRRRPSPFVDDDTEDTDELRYEDDPDVVQDMPDDEF